LAVIEMLLSIVTVTTSSTLSVLSSRRAIFSSLVRRSCCSWVP